MVELRPITAAVANVVLSGRAVGHWYCETKTLCLLQHVSPADLKRIKNHLGDVQKVGGPPPALSKRLQAMLDE